MARFEGIPIVGYRLQTVKLTQPEGSSIRKVDMLEMGLEISTDKYSGLVGAIRMLFFDPNASIFVIKDTIGDLRGVTGSGGGANDIVVYAGAGEFRDFYHIIQTEKPLTFYYSTETEFGSSPLAPNTSIRINRWGLTTSQAGEAEPIGEGFRDRSV